MVIVGRNWQMHRTIRLLVFVLGFLVASPTLAGSYERCKSSDSELSTRGCSEIVKVGGVSKKELATVYASRGFAYANKGAHYWAITDYDVAIGPARFPRASKP